MIAQICRSRCALVYVVASKTFDARSDTEKTAISIKSANMALYIPRNQPLHSLYEPCRQLERFGECNLRKRGS